MKLRPFIPALIIAAGFWAYHNSFQGPFIFDDAASVVRNPRIRHLWPIWDALSPSANSLVGGRPIVNLSLAINHAWGGTAPWGYHACNLAIHVLAALTLYGIVRRTLARSGLREQWGESAKWVALAVAVIWTVHPLQTEAVNYISQRCELLMGLFYLLTLYGFIRGVECRRPVPWFCASVAACFLGMASKEVMVTVPLMVLLYDRLFVSGSFRQVWNRHRGLYLGLAGSWLWLGFLMAGVHRRGVGYGLGCTWWGYALAECRAVVKYLGLALWPHPLIFDYGDYAPIGPAAVAPYALILAALATGVLYTPMRHRAIGFVGAWLFVILAPTSSVVPIAGSPMAEHRMYLPLAAVVVLAVVGAVALRKRLLPKQQGVVLGCAVCWGVMALLAFLTIRRNRDYSSEVSIWQDTVEKCPNNVRAHYNLGTALGQLGRAQEAIGQYEQTLLINPDYAEAHNNWGIALQGMGQMQDAINHYEQALRIKPDYPDAHDNLGTALERLGRLPEAIDHYEQALHLDPNHVAAHNNLGGALVQAGRVREAIPHFERALRIKSDFAGAHYNWGLALVQEGKLEEAIGQYEQALRIKPDYAEAQINLGNAMVELGRIEDAIGCYQQALRIEPDDAGVHYTLGSAFMRLGRISKAISHYEQALRLKPDFASAHTDLESALDKASRVQEAIEHWEQALQTRPGDAEAHNNLGCALVQVGRQAEAIEHWEQALRINPDFAEAHYNLGLALEQTGGVREAIKHWEQALRINPNFAEAHYNLGLALDKAGRVQEAIRHWEQALQIRPGDAQAHYNLGIAYEQVRRAQEAIQQYEQALRIKPDFVQAQNALARLRTAQ